MFHAVKKAVIGQGEVIDIFPDRLISVFNAQNLFGDPVNGGHGAIFINRNNPVADTIQHEFISFFPFILWKVMYDFGFYPFGDFFYCGKKQFPVDLGVLVSSLQINKRIFALYLYLHGNDVKSMFGDDGGYIRHDAQTVPEQ